MIQSPQIEQINPNFILNPNIDEELLTSGSNKTTSFDPEHNHIEYFIYNLGGELINNEYFFSDWSILKNSKPEHDLSTNIISLSPSQNLITRGFDVGEFYSIYNFVNYELGSSPLNPYFIKEISSDRTEINISSNNLLTPQIREYFNNLKLEIDENPDFVFFYVSLFNNINLKALNIELIEEEDGFYFSIKLFNPLSEEFSINSRVYIFTKIADSIGYKIKLHESITDLNNITSLQGPNTNLDIKDLINPSGVYKNKQELLETLSQDSENNLENFFTQKGVKITPNYSYNTFDEFVNFSSAKQRILNFIEKVKEIEDYTSDLKTLEGLTLNPTTNTNIKELNLKIKDIISGFDGYEYYLYYNNSEFSYPKTGSSFPYELLPSNSTTVLNWLGDDKENSQYYGGIILSASVYDENNPNWLYYTIPEYLREDQNNTPYLQFCNMVGQHFDELWLYTKALTEKLNSTNELDKGVPLKLVEETIKSFGYNGFGNNYNIQDNYVGLIGENNRNYIPPTGSEWITDYIAVNKGDVVNYWNPEYSYLFYVESFLSKGFPYAIDRVSKEIFKRLYHNMVYLIKKKGTIAGLRHLINIWGIPDTILRINEFGGIPNPKTDLKHWKNVYNYAYTPVGTQHNAGSSLEIPWMPLNQNYISKSEYIVPDTIMFRFKTTGYPSSSIEGEFFTQSLLVKKSNGDPSSTEFDFGISLEYLGSNPSNYSGSNLEEGRDLGNLKLYISGSVGDGGTISTSPITLPFYNKEWWSIMLRRSPQVNITTNGVPITYELFAQSKTTHPQEETKINHSGSSILKDNILISINESWNKFGISPNNGIYLGGYISGSQIGNIILTEPNKIFSGSLQEFRYYSTPISKKVFDSYTLNPQSIQGMEVMGDLNPYNILSFRAPLGSELDNKFILTSTSSYVETLQSVHPLNYSELDSNITGSFINPSDNSITSSYEITYYDNISLKTFSKPNVEYYYIPQPYIGNKSPINDKITTNSGSIYGEVLSLNKSLDQKYPISKKSSLDNNKLEVSFSPQDEINEDIFATYGDLKLFEDLGDPKKQKTQDNKYSFLNQISKVYFGKYSKRNPYDFIRLIKYFDNSLFKAIKGYVPARTNLSTGIVIKSHLLERNKYQTSSPNINTPIFMGEFNTPIIVQNLELKTNILIGDIKGGTGGVLEGYNYILPNIFGQYYISQSWIEHIPSTIGLLSKKQDTQKEFYNGEFSGSEFSPIDPHVFKEYPIKFSQSKYNVRISSGSLYTLSTTNSKVKIYDLEELAKSNQFSQDSPSFKLDTFLKNITFPIGVLCIVVTIRDRNPEVRHIAGIAIRKVGEPEIAAGHTGWNELSEEYLGDYPTGSFYGDNLPRPSFFQLSLPLPDTGSITHGGDPLAGGLPWNTIISSGLNVFDSGYNTWSPSEDELSLIIPRRWWVFNYDTNSISQNKNIISGSSGFNWEHGGEYSIASKDFFFLSPLRTLNESTPVSAGECSIIMQPVTFYVTSFSTPNFYEWYPIQINIHSFDINGNDCRNTLANNPNYTIELNSTPLPPYIDSFGLGGNIIQKNHLNLILQFYNYSSNYHGFIFSGDSRHNQTLLSKNEVYFNFTPLLPSDFSIENSDFNPLLNNYNLNRLNSKIMDVDYLLDIITPNNLSSILSNKAQKAELPDSNYSSFRNIIPRYLGSKVKSLDYNKYTPSGSIKPSLSITHDFVTSPIKHSFINGDTGSWGGDISLGKTSTIDKYPLYIAQFKNHKKEYSRWDVDSYQINKLILIPYDDTPIDSSYSPQTLELGGSDEYIYEVVNSLEKNRNVEILFNETLNLKSKPKKLIFKIIDPAVEYLPLISNQITENTTFNTFSFERFSTEHYLITQSINTTSFVSENVLVSTISPTTSQPLLYTGSNSLILSGSSIDIFPFSKPLLEADVVSGSMGLGGPFLGVLHTYNQCVARGYIYESSSVFNSNLPSSPYVTMGVTDNIDRNQNENYISWKPFSPNLSKYSQTQTPFLLEVGDTIRVSYSITGNIEKSTKLITQDFTITKVDPYFLPPNPMLNDYKVRLNNFTNNGSWGIENLFNTVQVHPNPETLKNPIPQGKIYSFTIRRKNFVDNNIIIDSKNFEFQNIQKTFKEGFLIPQDLSKVQRDNVLNVITQLKSKNAFTKN